MTTLILNEPSDTHADTAHPEVIFHGWNAEVISFTGASSANQGSVYSFQIRYADSFVDSSAVVAAFKDDAGTSPLTITAGTYDSSTFARTYSIAGTQITGTFEKIHIAVNMRVSTVNVQTDADAGGMISWPGGGLTVGPSDTVTKYVWIPKNTDTRFDFIPDDDSYTQSAAQGVSPLGSNGWYVFPAGSTNQSLNVRFSPVTTGNTYSVNISNWDSISTRVSYVNYTLSSVSGESIPRPLDGGTVYGHTGQTMMIYVILPSTYVVQVVKYTTGAGGTVMAPLPESNPQHYHGELAGYLIPITGDTTIEITVIEASKRYTISPTTSLTSPSPAYHIKSIKYTVTEGPRTGFTAICGQNGTDYIYNGEKLSYDVTAKVGTTSRVSVNGGSYIPVTTGGINAGWAVDTALVTGNRVISINLATYDAMQLYLDFDPRSGSMWYRIGGVDGEVTQGGSNTLYTGNPINIPNAASVIRFKFFPNEDYSKGTYTVHNYGYTKFDFADTSNPAGHERVNMKGTGDGVILVHYTTPLKNTSKHNVTFVNLSNSGGTVNHETPYSVALLPLPNKTLPNRDGITVTIGGTQYTGFGYLNGVLSIPGPMVRGNIIITAQLDVPSFGIEFEGDVINPPGTVTYNMDYSTVLIPKTGYTLPDDASGITVTIGGVRHTGFGYTSSTGVLSILGTDITGGIVVTVTGVARSHCDVVIEGEVNEAGAATTAILAEYSVTLTPNTGFLLPNRNGIHVEIGGAGYDGFNYDATTGQFSISAEDVVDDIHIIVDAYAGYNVTITTTLGGRVTYVNGLDTGAVEENSTLTIAVASATNAALTAAPISTNHFVSWTKNTDPSTYAAILTTSGAGTYVAKFTASTVHVLTVDESGGTVMVKVGSDIAFDYTAPVNIIAGSQVTLTASKPSVNFSYWSGDLTGTANPLTIAAMDDDY
ncbi:MAG: hypothetical protein LBV63_03150, partial [Candidatus Methanoplasma sp.]|nr:hypothetical protein [Candidatus Methanoplasma sp.]